MQFPLSSKLEKVASKDQTRPALTHCHLESRGEGLGWLVACDSYKLARIPVQLDEGDELGFVPVAALAAAKKARQGALACNGSVAAPDGTTYPRYEGQYPDSERLIPTEPIAFTVGVNAKFLAELAAALGSDVVKLSFVMQNGEPSQLKPIIVHPDSRGIVGADGIIMPVRVS